MVALQVRDVPEELHEALKQMAKAEGKSLNMLLLDELRQIVRRGRNREVFERSRQRLAGSIDPNEIARIIRAQRDAAADAG